MSKEQSPESDARAAKIKNEDYERELAILSVELVKLQEWVKRESKKICVVFEGRDCAGKGGDRQGARCHPAHLHGRRPSGADRARKMPDVGPALSAASAGGGRKRLDPGPVAREQQAGFEHIDASIACNLMITAA